MFWFGFLIIIFFVSLERDVVGFFFLCLNEDSYTDSGCVVSLGRDFVSSVCVFNVSVYSTQKPSDAHLSPASCYKFSLGQVQSQLGIRSSWLIEFLVWAILQPGINRLYLYTWDHQTLSVYLGSSDSTCIPGINRLYLHTWDQQTLSPYLGSTDSICIPGINRLYLHT